MAGFKAWRHSSLDCRKASCQRNRDDLGDKAHKNVEVKIEIKRPRTPEAVEQLQEFNARKASESDYRKLESEMEPLTLAVTPSEKGTIGLELSRKTIAFKKKLKETH